MNFLTFLLTIFLLTFIGNSQSQQCEKFVRELIDSIFKLNISSIPLQSIMYSGITTNNPGQFYECSQQPNFSYYLVTKKNTTTNINSFSGLCVPSQCSKDDIKIALDSWNCQVYDYQQDQSDALAIVGVVVLSIWFGLVIIWSIVISYREPQVNEYVKKEKEEIVSVNSLVDRESQNNLDDQSDKTQLMKSKIFNYYEGYTEIFRKQKRKSVLGSFLCLAALSILVSFEFSFKQTIASNPAKAYDFFDSFLGIFVTNIELAYSLIMFILGMKLADEVYKFVTFQQIGKFFFNHLLKKWVFFIIVSLSIYGVMSYTDQPLSKYWSVNFGQDCPKYIWQDWLLFRNFQIDSKVCLPWLWILQAEIFLSLICAPFIVIFRINKKIGYALMTLVCLLSMIIGFAILSDQSISFEPTKMFNMQKQYSINYQTNTLVRAGTFYFGLLFGFFVIEGLQKVQGKGRTSEYKLAKMIRKSKVIQNCLHIFGVILMVLILSLIALFFKPKPQGQNQNSAFFFLMFTPMVFLIGFGMFILPSYWQVETGPSYFINKIFGWSGWNSLEKLTLCILAVGPALMGFTTYSSQNNIYFDLQTITVYLLGDLLIIYVIALLVCAAIENQINFIFNYLERKIFGKSNKLAVLLEDE